MSYLDNSSRTAERTLIEKALWEMGIAHDYTVLLDGEPCNHSECLHHVTHPCENCGRIAGKGIRIMMINYIERKWWV